MIALSCVFALSCEKYNRIIHKNSDNYSIDDADDDPCANTTSGISNVSSNIYNGEPVTGDSWISTVALTYTNPQTCESHVFCSGTLIKNNVVVTAAHCLDSDYAPFNQNIRVYVGNGIPNTGYRGQYRVKTAKTHSYYNPKYSGKIQYDFGYLELRDTVDSIQINKIISESEFESNVYIGRAVTLVGFGETEKNISGKKYYGDSEVDSMYYLQGETIPGEIRIDASNGYSLSSACYGDSGGTLWIGVWNF